MKNCFLVLVALGATITALGIACSRSDDDDAAFVDNYVQVERLARAAIVEALFPTHDFANAVNSITPAQEPGALVGPVAAEAIAVLDALDSVAGGENITAAAAIGALIPDVMRINTLIGSGYGAALNAVGSPVGGRRPRDDVMDITYGYLILGNPSTPVSDGVPYFRPASGAGSTNPGIGHSLMNDQSSTADTTTVFPFLARPN